jgi:hypothetical protein
MLDVSQVHLGSMGESIRTVIQRNGDSMAAGDVYVLNDPYNGGTHLPDVTVVSPVFDKAGEEVFALPRSAHDDASLRGWRLSKSAEFKGLERGSDIERIPGLGA